MSQAATRNIMAGEKKKDWIVYDDNFVFPP